MLHKTFQVMRCGMKYENATVIIPEPLHKKAIELCHYCMDEGHCGVDRTYIKVVSRFCLHGVKNLKDLVKDIVQGCEAGIVANGRPPRPVPLLAYPIPKEPWEITSMDLLSPLPVTRS